MLGSSITLVERTGFSIRSRFNQGSLWEASYVGERTVSHVSRIQRNIHLLLGSLYFMKTSVKSAIQEQGGQERSRQNLETLLQYYVGESSRSLQERSKEHQRDYKAGSDKSHMQKHKMVP